MPAVTDFKILRLSINYTPFNIIQIVGIFIL